MFDLDDSFWQIVGTIIAFCGLLLAVKLFPYQLKRKSLSYLHYSYSLLTDRSEGFRGQIRVLYEDHKVTNLNVLNITFSNDGIVEIRANDFDHPLSIQIDTDCKILSASVAGTSPAASSGLSARGNDASFQ